MFDPAIILNGLIIGVILAAPIGPVNLICIRRSIAFGRLNGFLSGMGAAVGDGIFAIVAAFGITAIAEFVTHYAGGLQLVGGLFLLGLGIHTYLSDPKHMRRMPEDAEELVHQRRVWTTFTATFFLTITNPATLFGVIAIFGGAGGLVQENPSYVEAGVLVLSVFLGSALWWLALTESVVFFRDKLSELMLSLINHVSGILIIGFGLFILGRLIFNTFF